MSDFVIPYRCVQQKWEWGALLADMDACLMRLIGYDSFCSFFASVCSNQMAMVQQLIVFVIAEFTGSLCACLACHALFLYAVLIRENDLQPRRLPR